MSSALRLASLIACTGFALAACGKKENPAPVERGGETTSPAAAATAAEHAQRLAGSWVRAAEPGATRTGIHCGAEGVFRPFGAVSASGLAWSVAGDSLHVTTNSDRYPGPEETRYRIVTLTDSALALAGMGPLAGTYARDDGACAFVTGTVTYRQRIALPSTAVVEVTLQDISRQDAPATLLAREVILTGGRQAPIPFTLAYDADAIDSRFTYAVAARITNGGKLLFINDTVHPVITREAPSEVEVVVKPVGR
jgi:putative lipoprotein